MTNEPAIDLVQALTALHRVRRDEIVVTTMGTAREWMELGAHPLDFVYVPSSMGQATSIGLGLALAQPERNIVVCNGDGSMLMNLGSLVTIAAQAPANLTVLVFDNGVYEVTGAQATPGAAAHRASGRGVDFAGIAKSAGFSAVREFTTLDEWEASVRDVIEAKGPTFARIAVASVPGAVGPRSPSNGKERARAFARALRE